MGSVLNEWAFERVTKWVKSGGELATPEHAAARIAICDGCEFKGKVMPIPGVYADGCTICQCPFITKAHMLSVDSDLVVAAINAVSAVPIKKNEPIICPHKDGNKWAETDKKFLTNKNQ